MTAERWALNWYQTRRHIVHPADDTRALCSLYTSVWTQGRNVHGEVYAAQYVIPAADTPEVMERKACRLCERIAAKATKGPS